MSFTEVPWTSSVEVKGGVSSVRADKLSFQRRFCCILLFDTCHLLTEIVLQQLQTCYIACNFSLLGKIMKVM